LIFSLYSVQVIIDKVKELTLTGPDHKEYAFRIAEEDIQYCFGLSKMTVVDDNEGESKYFKLKFVEMFECLARLACLGKLEEIRKEEQVTPRVSEMRKPGRDDLM
jgi:hypothetical protein